MEAINFSDVTQLGQSFIFDMSVSRPVTRSVYLRSPAPDPPYDPVPNLRQT